MLSPHEIAALMILKSANENLDLDPADLKTLERQRLVKRHRAAQDLGQVRLTNEGRDYLDTVAKMC